MIPFSNFRRYLVKIRNFLIQDTEIVDGWGIFPISGRQEFLLKLLDHDIDKHNHIFAMPMKMLAGDTIEGKTATSEFRLFELEIGWEKAVGNTARTLFDPHCSVTSTSESPDTGNTSNF